MENPGNFGLIVWISSMFFLVCLSLGYNPVDNYLIHCGSFTNISVGDRVFVADNSSSSSYTLSTPEHIFANSSSNSISLYYDSALYQTARIFNGPSHYSFSIKEQGRHWIRLHFFPLVFETYNMSKAKFSVSAQNFTLISEPQLGNGSVVKEYSLNITSNKLVLTFTPSANSFAFINALEVFSIPDNLIPKEARTIDSKGGNRNLWEQALETVARVDMGNTTVLPQNDTLWRLWVSDDAYRTDKNLGSFVSNVKAVNFTGGLVTEDFAPASVYGTATMLNSSIDPNLNANLTWSFDVSPGFDYLVRLHFCDIMNKTTLESIFVEIFVNTHSAGHLNLGSQTSNVLGAPYFMDVCTRASASAKLNVSVGPSNILHYPTVILNGLEIMKINNARGSLDDPDVVSSRRSKMKVVVIVGLAVGSFVVVVLAAVIFLFCRRRKPVLGKEEHFSMNRGRKVHTTGSKYSNGTAIFSSSKIGYRFPFMAILEATDNFSENLVIGVGGFGKVYRGVLRDETEVAVKRGAPQSNQGLIEFQTEIEMLSQFRHRHLVSLIGYCDEQNEMIIIYEYMENGTLKNHLYGSSLPGLSWRQRLEICIGSAKGLHYLHTGSAKKIIHRDVKSANILLDKNFMAKVADFGLSKTGPDIDQTHVSTAVKGSFGYLDPEYLTRQKLTEKSDVYSFGVVLLEVLCGRPVIDPSLSREKVNLVDWAMKSCRNGKLEEIVDPSLVGQIKPASLRKFWDITEKCLAEHGIYRPSMGDVLWNLESAFQINEEKSNQNGELSSQISHVSDLETSLEFSRAGGLDDLAGISMSTVFAQMVREEMR
ncbi:probable receptor-like protein kinase At5g59700 [Durio zibethinus]|uniref:Probable receptor-like protein kinase At5g59700 n=1 Tax=Durio zibethinus TaxID=66656 RepID=A0A6P6AK55_DURZI|nr:probable receptor-like protein kinase At5g59700 [Durio zibethinus]